MFRFLRPVLGRAILACALLAVYMVIEIRTVDQVGSIVNHLQSMPARSTTEKDAGFLRWLLGEDPSARLLRSSSFLLLVLVVLMLVLRFLRELANSFLSMTMVYYIREAVYDKLQRVGFGFHDAISTGQLINRALTDLQNVRAFLQTAVLQTLEIALTVVMYIGLIWSKSHWLAVLSLLPLPIWTGYILRFSRKVQPVAKLAMEAGDRNVSLITENIAGVHVVKAFATEGEEIRKYDANCEEFKSRVLQRIRMHADFQPVIRLIASASHMLLFVAAGWMIIRSRGASLGVGDLVVLSGAMWAILSRLQGVATINEQYQEAIVSARRLHEILDAGSTVPEKPNAPDLPPGPGEIVFENVEFAYVPGKPVLHGISFRARAGSVVAIVGPTGAGKTSLVNLISRFYDPTAGRIQMDGMDLRDVSLSSLRRAVGFVFQETYLFSDTVSANIAYGRPGITAGAIESAARLAQAHEFIEKLPRGYESLLGERGTNLSGGQRQRLAIARAIVTDPRVLVLDDATAAVDPETEHLIRRALRLVMFERTTFVIAHRISTVKQADLVLVLENGRITQSGTHDELITRQGHYQEICRAQLIDDGRPSRRTVPEPSHMRRVRDTTTLEDAQREARSDLPEPEF